MSFKRKFAPDHLKAVRHAVVKWSMLPKRMRDPKTLTELARKFGISLPYASRIRNSVTIDDYLRDVEADAMKYYDQIVQKIAQQARAGDPRAERLYRRLVASKK